MRPAVHRGELRGINAADAAGWARRFAEDSYGNALLACVLALLLRPTMPEGVQVGIQMPLPSRCDKLQAHQSSCS